MTMKPTSFPKLIVLTLIGIIFSFNLYAQNFEKFFPAKDLTSVGVYYYPEHWDSTQWDRDFQNMSSQSREYCGNL